MSTQTRKAMTASELRRWFDEIEDPYANDLEAVTSLRLVTRDYPPCPGCGGLVAPNVGCNAVVTVDMKAQTAAFYPCGCTLDVTGMPPGPVAW